MGTNTKIESNVIEHKKIQCPTCPKKDREYLFYKINKNPDCIMLVCNLCKHRYDKGARWHKNKGWIKLSTFK